MSFGLSSIPFIGSAFDTSGDSLVSAMGDAQQQYNKQRPQDQAAYQAMMKKMGGYYNPAQQGLSAMPQQPGQGENFFGQTQSRYLDPNSKANDFYNQAQTKLGQSPASQYWNGIQGHANSMPKVSNNAQGAYDQFRASQPADTSPYYDNAEQQSSKLINRQMAARGMGDSSAAVGALAQNSQSIRGQQAQANAQYGLSRAGLAGNLAQNADQSSALGANTQRDWMVGLGGLGATVENADTQRLLGQGSLAFGLDASGLNRLQAGQGAANQAQGLGQDRSQAYFADALGLGNAQESSQQQMYTQMLQRDQALQQAGIDANLAKYREAANQSRQQRADLESGLSSLGGLAIKGMTGGIL